MKSFEQFLEDISKYQLTVISDSLRRDYRYANGCGAKGGVHFPSTMWLVNIESACHLHDIQWQNSSNYSGLLRANENFSRNLKRITDYESMNDFTRWLRRMRIAKYVAGVELFGTEAYAKERGFY